MDVGYFLQFQCTFKSHREIITTAQIDEIMGIRKYTGYLGDKFVMSEYFLYLLRNTLQLLHQFAPAGVRDGALLFCQRQSQKGQSRNLRSKCLGRGHSYLRTGMSVAT
jgi:hypothetical protein